MKIIFALTISILCGISAYSQNANVRPQTILPDTARFQIFFLEPSSLAVKLDRYSGKTYQYSNERRWYLLEVRGGLPVQTIGSTPRYEIYDEGDSLFLINQETGQSWIFNVRTWEPIRD